VLYGIVANNFSLFLVATPAHTIYLPSHFSAMSSTSFCYEWLISLKAIYFIFSFASHHLFTIQESLFKHRFGLSVDDVEFARQFRLVSFFGTVYWTWIADTSGRIKHVTLLATVMLAFCSSLSLLHPDLLVTRDERVFVACLFSGLYSMFTSALAPIINAMVLSELGKRTCLAVFLCGAALEIWRRLYFTKLPWLS
jgi:hypothetical protein